MSLNTPEIERLAEQAEGWRRSGELAQACTACDQVLGENPQQASALRTRARIALSRGEAEALGYFDRALSTDPGNADLWLGKAQALDVAGDSKGAMAIARQLVDQASGWLEGHRFLAQLRLAAGDRDFASHYADATEKRPRDPNLWYDWANQLAATDRFAEAAEIATKASKSFPDEPLFVLLSATHLSTAGETELANQLFAGLELQSASRQRNEARHSIRRGDLDRAEGLLRLAIEEDDADIAAWALLGLVWRATENPKADWLHGQSHLIGNLPLAAGLQVLPDAGPLLGKLHGNAALPIGQSLRGGTQTRGNLFDRLEPELATLHQSIQKTLDEYRATLPTADPTHPLLKQRSSPWQLAGSWSVRLAGGGDHHKSHIHPSGVVSSALYIEIPEGTAENDAQAGWLELGRPPADLKLDLEPLALIRPQPGCLALFPSTLYHGTRPLSGGTRMSVAFDVVPKR